MYQITGEGRLPFRSWHELVERRIMGREELRRQAVIWHFFKKKVVFTNGCFDLLHAGHWHLLCTARSLGDALVVAINSDESVRRLKGKGRPLLDEKTRARLLASMVFVDAVTIFDEDTPLEVIKIVQPDILVKGADWQESEIVGTDVVRARGGEVVRIPLVEGYSTTALIEKARNI